MSELVRREAAPHRLRRRCAAVRRGLRPVTNGRLSCRDDAQQRTDGELAAQLELGLELFPALSVHADLATPGTRTRAAPTASRTSSVRIRLTPGLSEGSSETTSRTSLSLLTSPGCPLNGNVFGSPSAR